MVRRGSWGWLAAAAILAAIMVAGGPARIEMKLSLEGVTLSAATQMVRLELKL